jgi:hypothetical protein
MRSIMSAVLLAAAFGAAFGASSASAQSGAVHYNFCLLTDEAQECAYQTMAQCQASKRGNADFCMPNTSR